MADSQGHKGDKVIKLAPFNPADLHVKIKRKQKNTGNVKIYKVRAI